MTLRGTLFLVILALGLAIALFFIKPNQDHPKNAPLFHIDPSQVTSIVITDGNEFRSLTRHGDHWELNTPLPDQADTTEVMKLLGTAEELKPLDILAPQELKNQLSLSAIGLQEPKRSLLFHSENTPDQILYFGSEAVGEKRLFARFGKQQEVIIIPSTIADLAFQSSDHFYNHHLTSLSLEALREIKLSHGLGELSVSLNGTQWNMTEPFISLISSKALNTWMTPLFEAPILERVGNDQEELATYDLEKPRAILTLFSEGSSTPITLSLGKTTEEKKNEEVIPAVYIRSSERHAIFKVPRALENIFLISPDMLRDHQLCTINLDTVDRIEVTRQGTTLLLHRQSENHENWISEAKNSPVIPGSEIQQMVSRLEQINVNSFEIATPEKLQSTGLEPATDNTITLRFVAHLSENTPDDNAGDFLIQEIRFGNILGKTLFARIDHHPEIVEIPASALTNLFDFDLPALH